ncbi:hypothetical protein T10_8423 [Trichinella papuae]|uniref:Uncharacterized protein n=1 Tax=Trichinella papuae TaxID=268474 RepID=A0A0V1MGG5_9BILA|nr:hypothetical protein T10_8423 [Trichinella papuae]
MWESVKSTNNDADNSSENNSDGEEIEESLVSINEAYNSVQTLRNVNFNTTKYSLQQKIMNPR